MKTLAFVLVCCTAAAASFPTARDTARDVLANPTFTRTATTTSLLVPRDPRNSPSITFDVTHTYDRRTLELLETDFAWSVGDYHRTTYVRETLPPVFPNPPQVIVTPIEETLRILDWEAIAIPDVDVWGPRWVDYKRAWIASSLVDMSMGAITVERTLTGPESSQTSIFEIPAGEVSGYLQNAMTPDGWQPFTHYVIGNHNHEGAWVPPGTVDGFEVPPYHLTEYLPIAIPPQTVTIPEPDMVYLCAVIGCFIVLRAATR